MPNKVFTENKYKNYEASRKNNGFSASNFKTMFNINSETKKVSG